MVLTSNLKPPQLREQVGARAVSRLVEACAWIEMQGEDYRLGRKGGER
jgi:DNA replication protein DnaC